MRFEISIMDIFMSVLIAYAYTLATLKLFIGYILLETSLLGYIFLFLGIIIATLSGVLTGAYYDYKWGKK